jgi:hypothetical protein
MKSSYLVLIILAAILFVPLFLTPRGITGFYKQLLFLPPYRNIIQELNKYISLQIGDVVIIFCMRIIFYTNIVLITSPLDFI